MGSYNDQFPAQRIAGEGAFGDVITAELTPMCQRDFAYGGHDDEVYEFTATSGTIAYENSMAVLSTGASAFGTAFMRTTRAVRYRPGQGALFRFTAVFDTPAAGVSLTAGAYSGSENGLFVGYDYTDTGGTGGVPRFGFCRQHDGARVVYELEITAAASGAETFTITLNSSAEAVSVTAGTAAENAQEVAEHFAGVTSWIAEADGAKVYFLANNVGVRSGTYSASGSGTVAGTMTEKRAGAAVTEDWVYQGEFNRDQLDGSGPSRMRIDPTKGNIYQIRMQYLGFGAIEFGVEDQESGKFILAHRFEYANKNTVPSSSNPIYQLGGAVSNVTGTSNKSVSIGSVAGFVEGEFGILGPTHGVGTSGSIGATTTIPLLSIRSNQVFVDGVSKINLREMLPVLLGVSASGSNREVIVRLVSGGTLTNPLWQTYAPSHSFASYDTSATAITGGDTLLEISLDGAGDKVPLDLSGAGISVRPEADQKLTIVMETTGNAATYAASIAWKEDS